ncbi:MAG TPA: HEAT repeat domain-containing protein [Gemmataceae bacterium]|nr:HEAT repeat domain-containing protein [Gemmataceae bacterium]
MRTTGTWDTRLMADTLSQKLIVLLNTSQSTDVRRAAAVVLGEVGDKESKVNQALSKALDDPDPVVRTQVLIAIGKLKIEPALPQLLDRISQGGPEAELAAQAAAHLGAKGTHALQKLMGKVAPGLRRRIASALATGGTASSETAAVKVLLDSDPNVVDASVRSLLSEVPTLQPRHRRALTDHVLDLLRANKTAPLATHSEAALVRLLAGLGDPRAESIYWTRVVGPHSLELRAAALQALGTLPLPSQRDKLKVLLDCACDGDFRLAAPALMILKAAPVSDRTLDDWLPLFDAPDPATRRFAIEKLGHKDHPRVVQPLMDQLKHPDRSLGDQALRCLAQLRHGREALAHTFLAADSPDQAWMLARGQAPFAKDYPILLRNKIFAKACKFLESGDRRADAFLFLLRQAEGGDLRERLEERAAALRKKKQYAAALIYLKLLSRDPACGEPIRFELAACGLKLSDKALEADARAADRSLEQFAALLHRHAIDLVGWVAKAKWLEPEDLFYLGFHFVEGTKEEKEFGAGVLRLLGKRAPQTKLAKDARNKLRSQGLK